MISINNTVPEQIWNGATQGTAVSAQRGFVISARNYLVRSQMSKKKKPARPKHVPQRTCFVCREKRDKRQLTRLVRTPEGSVLVDPTGKQNGRGAYLCDQTACWDKVLENGRLLNQALKTSISDNDLAAIATHRPMVQPETELQEHN
jgi:hypothetical protein